MSSSAILRPGVAVGNYPQREDARDSWLDRTAASIAGSVRQRLHGRSQDHMKFVHAVNGLSEELAALDEATLGQRVTLIRQRLYSEGLEDELVAESFALIRDYSARRLGIRHHDVQVLGGYVMLSGMVAEMETGEGKTLTATLAACTAAMAGIPVHIVTVNDFLVARDAQWMTPLFQAMGLTVGVITEDMDVEPRRASYACDVVYCTNKQLVFDYLKDTLLLGQENRRLHMQLEGLHKEQPRTSRLLMRGLCYAIIDEADSVLVDEARTPLVISRKGDTAQEEALYGQAVAVARQLEPDSDFTLRVRDKQVEITGPGRASIAALVKPLGGLWSGARRRNELVQQALVALHLYHPDVHYLVQDAKVQIIDEYTGRVMPDRSWERGLHQMIEAKEGCPVSGRQETLARISYQRFFRRYLMLSGMTGTAQEIAGELWAVYRLNVVRVPTHRAPRRVQLQDKTFLLTQDKWKDIVATIADFHRQGRPVLVGTRSVADSEHLGSLLREEGLVHYVLNARQDEEEAEIIAQAGQPGRITVATNMAGRGTDIRLAEGVAEAGGLHVLATSRHEARRIDRQLSGRGGRQGDPGSYQTIMSLEDDLIKEYLGGVVIGLLSRWRETGEPLPAWLGGPIIWLSQFRAERHHSRIRRELLKIDDQRSDMLAFSGRAE